MDPSNHLTQPIAGFGEREAIENGMEWDPWASWAPVRKAAGRAIWMQIHYRKGKKNYADQKEVQMWVLQP